MRPFSSFLGRWLALLCRFLRRIGLLADGECRLDPMRAKVCSVLLVLGSKPDVNRGEQRENERLDDDDDGPEKHERDGDENRDHTDGDAGEEVVDGHVHHETNRERDGPYASGDELDREDERRQVPLGAGEVLDVAKAIGLQAVVVERDEDAECATER